MKRTELSARTYDQVLDDLAWRLDDVELELSCWHVTGAGIVLVPSTPIPQ